MVRRPMRSATRWPPRISSERRTWSSWHGQQCAGVRQEATLLGWLKALPDELVHARPVLSVDYAGVLLQSGELEGVEARLRDAERWLDMTADRRERPEAHRRRWSSWTKRNFAVCPVRSPCTVPDGPGSGRCGRHREIRPAGARPRAGGRPSLARSGSGVPGACILDERGSRGSAPDRMPRAWRICSGPDTSLMPSVAPSPWRIYGLRKVVSARQ